MAYDEELASRIRGALVGVPSVTERRMFGGLGFMVAGNMAVAASGTGDLLVRADPGESAGWIDGETVRPMEMRGKPMAGWLYIAASAVADDDALSQWVDRGVARAQTFPPK